MDRFQTFVGLIPFDCFVASADLKDAYYLVAISKEDRKIAIKCINWENTWYLLTYFPLSTMLLMEVYKTYEAVFSTLQQMSHQSSPITDHSFLSGQSYNDCATNLIYLIKIMDGLGLVANPKKLILIHTKELVVLGLLWIYKPWTFVSLLKKACSTQRQMLKFVKRSISNKRSCQG